MGDTHRSDVTDVESLFRTPLGPRVGNYSATDTTTLVQARIDMFSDWLSEALGISKNELKVTFNKFPLVVEIKSAIQSSRGKRTRILAVVDKSSQPCEVLNLTLRGHTFKYQNTLKSIMIEASEEALRWLIEAFHSECQAMMEAGDNVTTTSAVARPSEPGNGETVECCSVDVGDDEIQAEIDRIKTEKDFSCDVAGEGCFAFGGRLVSPSFFSLQTVSSFFISDGLENWLVT